MKTKTAELLRTQKDIQAYWATSLKTGDIRQINGAIENITEATKEHHLSLPQTIRSKKSLLIVSQMLNVFFLLGIAYLIFATGFLSSFIGNSNTTDVEHKDENGNTIDLPENFTDYYSASDKDQYQLILDTLQQKCPSEDGFSPIGYVQEGQAYTLYTESNGLVAFSPAKGTIHTCTVENFSN